MIAADAVARRGGAGPGAGRVRVADFLFPAPASPPAAPSPIARDPLAGRHREQAEALERDGQLRRAAEEWKIALTIAPADARTRESLPALQAGASTSRWPTAGRGAQGARPRSAFEARRKFLTALALRPSNRAAFEALPERHTRGRFIAHGPGGTR